MKQVMRKAIKRIDELTNTIFDQQKWIKELIKENKQYKDAIDRQNKYIESNRTAIERFDESNRGN